MFSPTASSATAWIAPPVSRAVATAKSPSAGLPIASERAIEFGRTGVTVVRSRNAVATGWQPAAWPPTSAGPTPSTRPRARSSANPCPTLWKSAPEAIGATTTSGVRQSSCSAISYASVFEPSA